MQKKIMVLLLGTNAYVASVFRQHRHHYTLVHQEDEEINLSVPGAQQPHLIVLAQNNLQRCQQIRQKWPVLPLVMVSENPSEQLITRALDLGADAYMTMPFGEGEFLARMRALLRRVHAFHPLEIEPGPDLLTSNDGKIELHIARHRCMLAGQEIRLTATEFELLRVMMIHQEKALSHRFLLQQIWGPEYGDESNYVRVYVRQLRRKIEPDAEKPTYIHSVPGIGYRFSG